MRDLTERYPAQALVVELDVTRHEQVPRSVTEASGRFGRIDVLVNTTSHLFEANVNGEHPQQSAGVAEAIIAAVDAENGEADVHG